ncbi:hypothetical protein [Paludisphaera mucosa]|uniref:Exonuclease domain-containing protein n=1 Tax=Paludisphaera mucosa TaxID=3030827 RepID=A0ABT6FJP3_9BACT|nr:hypothetical protein [Paludisphaera mucosa]MDG3007573.1 hypothetical protein [Paludisphaera mucosa]
MIPVKPGYIHCPIITRDALAKTREPIVIDIETTGVKRHNQIVSVGLFIDRAVHILFVGANHVSIKNLPGGVPQARLGFGAARSTGLPAGRDAQRDVRYFYCNRFLVTSGRTPSTIDLHGGRAARPEVFRCHCWIIPRRRPCWPMP